MARWILILGCLACAESDEPGELTTFDRMAHIPPGSVFEHPRIASDTDLTPMRMALTSDVGVAQRVRRTHEPHFTACSMPLERIGPERELTVGDLSLFKAAIANAQTYWPNESYACMFNPDVVVVLSSSTGSVEIVLCFSCGAWVLCSGTSRSGGNFRGGSEVIGDIVASMFPGARKLIDSIDELDASVEDERRRFGIAEPRWTLIEIPEPPPIEGAN